MSEGQTCERQPLSALSSATSIEALLTDFDRHLERQRGCTEGTRKHYLGEARALLLRVFPAQEINWDNLTAGQIADFVSGRAQKLSLVSRQNPATAIRRGRELLWYWEAFRYLKGGSRVISLANLKAEAEIVLAGPHQILYAEGAWKPNAPPRTAVVHRRLREPADNTLF